jgi:hypothetical protein
MNQIRHRRPGHHHCLGRRHGLDHDNNDQGRNEDRRDGWATPEAAGIAEAGTVEEVAAVEAADVRPYYRRKIRNGSRSME